MTELENVVKGLEQFITDFKPFCGNKADWQKIYDALALLKAQEPHIIMKKDFKNNPSADENGYLPAYCEKIDRPIGWMAIHKGYIGARKDIRYWTGKPTAEQRKAVNWK